MPYSDIKKLDFFFDLVVIGTPPNNYYKLFKFASKYLKFKKILIEKLIANYLEDKIYYLSNYLNNYQIYCGYNHSVNPSLNYFKANRKNKKYKLYFTELKEGWNGILNAHPWLKNEFSSYWGNLRIGVGLHKNILTVFMRLFVF